VKPAPFTYHAPDSVDAAVQLLTELDDAKVLGGGQSLTPLLNMRLAVFEHLVDLRRVDELRGIEQRGDVLWIGASTTQAAAERSDEVRAQVPLLAAALPLIGHFQIRNRGTIGGSIAHADPAAELPAVALTLDAEIETRSPRGSRTIGAREFFTGIWSTALDEDEIVTGVRFPIWSGRRGFAVDEIARRHGDFAIAGACVAVELGDDDAVRRCAIGLLGLGPTPRRAEATERSVVGSNADDIDTDELGRSAVDGLTDVPTDLNGSADYRRRIGATVVARAWRRAIEEARHA
jgi:carbon-monoxide dehydrogenase medium subunit